jgi:hypothetical protein
LNEGEVIGSELVMARCDAAALAPVRRLQAEADINLPTTLAKSVENDLKRTKLRRLPILAALAYCALDR